MWTADSDQTAQMHMIQVFTGCIVLKLHFITLKLICFLCKKKKKKERKKCD